MSEWFYGRVSTKEQNLERQLVVARQYKNIPVENVYCDKQSGKNFDRTEYQKLKSVVKSGDEVIVKELDRLGRNKDEIKAEIAWFKDNGVTLRILDVPTTLIDFQGQEWIRDMVNNILIEVLGAMAEQEREEEVSEEIIPEAEPEVEVTPEEEPIEEVAAPEAAEEKKEKKKKD